MIQLVIHKIEISICQKVFVAVVVVVVVVVKFIS
jgi:hypothetical protein